MSGRLEGKVAVVTGGGNGIGRACAERFAEEGADIVVADLLEADAADTAALVEKQGRSAVAVRYDATSAADNESVMQRAVEEFGALDVIVTAAGISHSEYRSGDTEGETLRLNDALARAADPATAFCDVTSAEWHKVIDVNLTGSFFAVQSAARRMIAAGTKGSIVTIASIAAKVPEAGPVSYGVSKAGVWMLTKQAARSLGPAGIRVNAIGPGFIDTNMTRLLNDLPLLRDQLLAQIPLGRMGEPREIADTALFLASSESSYFTGEILHPDGGFYTD